MTRRILVTLMLALGLAGGCADADGRDSTNTQSPEENDKVGELGSISLSLSSTDSKGRAYRMRQANFVVTEYDYYYYGYDGGAPQSLTLSSETDLNLPVLGARLEPGEYSVALQPGWYVERKNDVSGAYEPVAKAVLLTPELQYTSVWPGQTSTLQYRIGVDGDLIDFRYGDLTIRTVIELPGESGGTQPCGYDGSGYPYGYPPYPPCYPEYPIDGGWTPVTDGGWTPVTDAGVDVPDAGASL
jgi:hypothetical protein